MSIIKYVFQPHQQSLLQIDSYLLILICAVLQFSADDFLYPFVLKNASQKIWVAKYQETIPDNSFKIILFTSFKYLN